MLVFGSRAAQGDSLAFEVAEKISASGAAGVEFTEARSVDDVLEAADGGRNVFILDVAKGLRGNRVEIIDDFELLKEKKLTSLHDFDVGFFLRLLAAAGEAPRVKIIAIPWGMDAGKAAAQARELLK